MKSLGRCTQLNRSIGRMEPEKVRAVCDWPQPEVVSELRRLLGLSGYYRRFIPKYAEIVAPLHSLLRNFGTASLSSRLMQVSTGWARYSHKSKRTDWLSSDMRAGSLNRSSERNMEHYSSIKLELLVLHWAVTQKFRDYLIGAECVVYMDNNH